jgi:hypothetical protein
MKYSEFVDQLWGYKFSGRNPIFEVNYLTNYMDNFYLGCLRV